MNNLNDEIQKAIKDGNVMDEESRGKLSKILFNHFYNIEYNGINDLSSVNNKYRHYIDSVKGLLEDNLLKYITTNNHILSEKQLLTF